MVTAVDDRVAAAAEAWAHAAAGYIHHYPAAVCREAGLGRAVVVVAVADAAALAVAAEAFLVVEYLAADAVAVASEVAAVVDTAALAVAASAAVVQIAAQVVVVAVRIEVAASAAWGPLVEYQNPSAYARGVQSLLRPLFAIPQFQPSNGQRNYGGAERHHHIAYPQYEFEPVGSAFPRWWLHRGLPRQVRHEPLIWPGSHRH